MLDGVRHISIISLFTTTSLKKSPVGAKDAGVLPSRQGDTRFSSESQLQQDKYAGVGNIPLSDPLLKKKDGLADSLFKILNQAQKDADNTNKYVPQIQKLWNDYSSIERGPKSVQNFFTETGNIDNAALEALKASSKRNSQRAQEEAKVIAKDDGVFETFVKSTAAGLLGVADYFSSLYQKSMGIIPFETNVPTSFGETSKALSDRAKKAQYGRKLLEGFTEEEINDGFGRQFAKGNYSKALSLAGSDFVELLPQVGLGLVPVVGLPTMTLSAGGGAWEDVRYDDKYSMAEKMVYAPLIASAEFFTEKFFGMDRRMAQDFLSKAFGKTVKSASEVPKKDIGDLLFKNVPKALRAPLEEGLEEGIVSTFQQTLDNIMAGKSFDPYEIAESAILGAGAGGSTYALVRGGSALLQTPVFNDVYTITNNVNKINELLKSEDIVPEEKEILSNRLNQFKTQLNQLRNEASDYYKPFSKEDKQRTLELNQAITKGMRTYGAMKTPEAKAEVVNTIRQSLAEKAQIEQKYDSTQKQQVPSAVVQGAQPGGVPIQGTSTEAPQAGGVLQVPSQQEEEIASKTKVIENSSPAFSFKPVSVTLTENNAPEVIGNITTYVDTIPDELFKTLSTSRQEVMNGVESISNVISSLSKSGRQVPVTVYATEDAWKRGTGQPLSRGIYVESEVEGQPSSISVFLPALVGNTVYHEGLHDVVPKVFGTKGIETVAKRLSQAVKQDPLLAAQLGQFVSNYEQSDKAEEFLAELGSRVSAGDIDIEVTKSLATRFMEAVASVLGAVGIKMSPNASQLSRAFLEYAQKLGAGVELGEIEGRGDAPSRVKAQKLTLQNDGTGIKLNGNESLAKGENAPTVATDKGEFFDDYTLDEILSKKHAPNSRVVTIASNLALGTISYTKDGETVSFEIPYKNEKARKKIESLRAKYKGIKGTGAKAKADKDLVSDEINKVAKGVISEFTDMMSQNLLALYDTLDDKFVQNSKEWYVGANRMAKSLAKKYNMSLEQSGGIIAVLSPQNDWFNNVSVAERVIDIMTNYSSLKLNDDLVAKAVEYNTDKKTQEPNDFAKVLTRLYDELGSVSIDDIKNPKDVTQRAIILRAIDQAMNSPKVAMTNPDGQFIGFGKTPVKWSPNSDISKAIELFRNGSLSNINENLGFGNKVRNFYNNIVDPNSETPYLTADTHALSAAVNAPISAKDASGIGLFNGQMEPFYAMVKQAYIDAAKVAGILPREMQSITWEAQRVGLNDKNRQENTKKKAFDYIVETRLNEQTPYERATILISRNRSKNPEWGEQRGIVTQRENNEILSEVGRRANERISALDDIRGRSKRGLGDADTAMGGGPSKGRASARKVESQPPLPEKGMGQGVSRPRKVMRMALEGYNEKPQAMAGQRLFNEPLKEAADIADKYYEKEFNEARPKFNGVKSVDKERAKRISDAYIEMEDNYFDPEVKKAYDAMVEETLKQFDFIVDRGYKVVINNKEPYKNSEDMITDLRDNKVMRIFSTESGFGDNPITEDQRDSNPLLKDSGREDANGIPLLNNDLFRFVHDFFGHAELGNGFGAVGEENAWNVHARMYSPIARRAMTSETRGQNSYVNFSGVNEDVFKIRDKAREERKKGNDAEADRLLDEVQKKMKFADQKVGLLPEEMAIPDGFEDTKPKPKVLGVDTPMTQEDQKVVDFVQENEDYDTTSDLKKTKAQRIPEKTQIAYKLFRVKRNQPGKLFPLYVKAKDEVPIGEWVDAVPGEYTVDKNGRKRVKSRIGDLAYRPGWHSGDSPASHHIGKRKKGESAPSFRDSFQVWAEVEVGADKDWQVEADARAKYGKDGKKIDNTADLDYMPEGGFYKYKTNPNMTGKWLISGEMKVNRILTDEEVSRLNEEFGIADLPRVKPMDWKNFGFEVDGDEVKPKSKAKQQEAPTKKAMLQIIGSNADLKEWTSKMLLRANEMERRGVKPKTIFNVTGWERGADKKWKYPVPPFKLDYTKVAQFNEGPIGNTVNLYDLIENNGRFKSESPLPGMEYYVHSNEGRTKENEDVFDFYPMFANIEVTLSDIDGPTFFRYVKMPGQKNLGSITISKYWHDKSPDHFLFALTHEIQHAVQREEGFAVGGSVATIDEEIDKVIKEDEKILTNKEKLIPALKNRIKFQEEKAQWYIDNGYSQRDIINDGVLNVLDGLNIQLRMIEDTERQLAYLKGVRASKDLSKKDKYVALAGEIEANNAAKRAVAAVAKGGPTIQMLVETEDIPREYQIIITPDIEEVSSPAYLKKLKAQKIAKAQGSQLEAQMYGYLLSISQKQPDNTYRLPFTLDDFLSYMVPTFSRQRATQIYQNVSNAVIPQRVVQSVPSIDDAYEASKKLLDSQKNKKMFTWDAARKFFLDRQATLKAAILKAGMKNAYNLLVNRAGSGARANYFFSKQEKAIYDGLSSKDIEALDKIIMLRRIAEIDKNFDVRGEKRPIHPNKLNFESAQIGLAEKRKELGDAKFNELNDRANQYFDAFKSLLDSMYDEGLINEDLYNRLKNLDYQPRMFIEHVFDMDELSMRDINLSANQVKRIKDGSEDEIMFDSRFLLAVYSKSTFSRIARNKVNRAIAEATSVKGNEEWISKDPKKQFSEVTYFEDGVRKQFYIKSSLKGELDDVQRFGAIPPESQKYVGLLSGSYLLKLLATRANPLFVFRNIPRDYLHVLFFTNVYDNMNMPLAMYRLAGDAIKGVKGKIKDDQDYKDFIEYGGGMEYLSTEGKEGMMTNRSLLNRTIEKLGSAGELSEIAFRLGMYKRLVQESLKNFNGTPTEEQLAQIKVEAVTKSREMIDFAQGGVATKTLESAVPYINAAFQGFRVSSAYIKNNPKEFVIKLGQLAIGLAVIAMYNAVMGDDDMEDIPEDVKRKYFIIMTPFTEEKDGKTVRKYIKIAKTQQLIPFISSLDMSLEGNLIAPFMGREPRFNEDTIKQSWDAFLSYFPKDPTKPLDEALSSVPLFSALSAYKMNYDTYRKRIVSTDYQDKNVLPAYEDFSDKNVPYFYKAIGQAVDAGPKRLQVATEKFITTPYSSLITMGGYTLMDAIASNVYEVKGPGGYTPAEQEAISNKALKSAGINVEKIFIGTTDPDHKIYNKREQIERINLEASTERRGLKLQAKELGGKYFTAKEQGDAKGMNEALEAIKNARIEVRNKAVEDKNKQDYDYFNDALKTNMRFGPTFPQEYNDITFATDNEARAKIIAIRDMNMTQKELIDYLVDYKRKTGKSIDIRTIIREYDKFVTNEKK